MILSQTAMESAADILGTTPEMLVDFAHHEGFLWVNLDSGVFFHMEDGELKIQFLKRKEK